MDYIFSISDFLIYYNDRPHLTAKLAPYKAMMNIEDKELVKNRDNTVKRRQNAKLLSENYPEEGVVKVSNFIRLVDDKQIKFNPLRGFKRSV